jgi:haloalkane dehalogenase
MTEPETSYPDRFLDLGGGMRIHYRDAGHGPPLLMLHGNPTWSYVYRDVIRGLAGSFRCVAPDYPGFGLSHAPAGYRFTPHEHSAAVERFVDALGLGDLTLFVHDWGGPIGLGFAGRRPELVRRLVLGNTWAWPITGDPHFERFSRLMGGPIGRVLIARFDAFVNVLLPAGVRRRRLPKVVMAMYRRPCGTDRDRRPTAVFPREIRASAPFLAEVEAGLARLRDRPALILWGTADFAFRPRERERLERLFPIHRTVFLEGAGHYIQEDAPDEIVQAIAAWSGDLLRQAAGQVSRASRGGLAS